MAILLVGIAIACVVMGFGFILIKDAKKLTSGTQATPSSIRILGATIMVVGIMILCLASAMANAFSDIDKQDCKYVGFIILGIAIIFVVIVGIAFTRGLTLSEFFHIVEIGEAEEKISEKNRKKIGISILVGSVILTAIFIFLVITNPFTANGGEARKCDYCGKEGASFSVGASNYCGTCYDAFKITKDRLEDN